MARLETITGVEEVIFDQTGVRGKRLKGTFQNAGIGGQDFENIQMELESKFNIEISDERSKSIRDDSTVIDLANMVEEIQSGSSAVCGHPPVSARHRRAPKRPLALLGDRFAKVTRHAGLALK